MPDFEIAGDIGDRIRELRQVYQETQPVFARRFGRGWQQVSSWERGEHRPPASVLELAAEKNSWPLALFSQGGPRPTEIFPADQPPPFVQEIARKLGAGSTVQEAINEAFSDVVRWSGEGITIEQAAGRAIQLIVQISMAILVERRTTAEESADLIRALHRQIGILGEGHAAGSPAPPAKAAGAE